jgi:hypothetical protein
MPSSKLSGIRSAECSPRQMVVAMRYNAGQLTLGKNVQQGKKPIRFDSSGAYLFVSGLEGVNSRRQKLRWHYMQMKLVFRSSLCPIHSVWAVRWMARSFVLIGQWPCYDRPLLFSKRCRAALKQRVVLIHRVNWALSASRSYHIRETKRVRRSGTETRGSLVVSSPCGADAAAVDLFPGPSVSTSVPINHDADRGLHWQGELGDWRPGLRRSPEWPWGKRV